jgi:polyhydroxyalkanoate synthesis regulator phasin
MAQLTVRNLSDDVIRELKARAKRHDRSLEAEVRRILSESVRPSIGQLRAEIDEFRERLRGKVKGDSTKIIRAARDSRG